MALVCVEAWDESALARARELADQLGVPLVGAGFDLKKAEGVKLLVGGGGLALGFCDRTRGKPYVVDFLNTTWKARFQQPLGRNHIFRRALGVRDEKVSVLDATAGFGQDAVLATSLGCKVTAVERSLAISLVLQDGIERARREDETLRSKLGHLTLRTADSLNYLKELAAADAPDVVYIDPMFDKPKKSAKSPKEMQLLQELLEPPKPAEEENLFAAALAVARRRVVVKRPLKGRALKSAPAHSFKGQSVRYDVYVKS
ncbi:MAG: class I SAM-dependent methyltransferase [Bdellovibrionales bacterium]|nr:class I SAM-dependent methyltransferase [Bdellovibrionales bacterium]